MSWNLGDHSSYPLCHYPYENENALFVNQQHFDMMEPHRPYSSSSNQSNSTSYYSDYSPPPFCNPFDTNLNEHYDFNSNGIANNLNIMERNNETIRKVEPIDGGEKKVMDKKLDNCEKSARPYNKKSDQEKKNPIYLETRNKNNIAVRRTRQKKKEEQEEKQKEFDKMKLHCAALKKTNDELKKRSVNGTIAITLIEKFKRELNSNPNIINFNRFPSLLEMHNFKN